MQWQLWTLEYHHSSLARYSIARYFKSICFEIKIKLKANKKRKFVKCPHILQIFFFYINLINCLFHFYWLILYIQISLVYFFLKSSEQVLLIVDKARYFVKYNRTQKVSTHKINWNAPSIKIRGGTRPLEAPTINQLAAFM